MPLNATQQQILEEWMRSKRIVQCPVCGDVDGWHLAGAAYVRALLEQGEPDLLEQRGVVRVTCASCGYVALFDAERLGIRGAWDAGGRDL